MPSLDQRLISAYLRTTYRCAPPYPAGAAARVFDLRIGQPQPAFDLWLADRQIDQFTFLTAWNPASQPLPAAENERRNRMLEKELQGLATEVLPGLGIGDNREWTEAGFFALALLPEQAVTLGRAFGQNALVFGRKGGLPELWWLPEQ